MARRPLVATVITTVVGSILGAGLGAVVGRVIALFGDETVETSLPMVFCGTIGYFVGGASAAKGSLDRFGARRTALGTTVATVILIVLVGGASLSRAAGVVVFVVGFVGAALAGVAAAATGAPRSEPVVRGQRPRAVAAPADAPAAPAEAPAAAPSLDRRPAVRKVPVEVAPQPESEPQPEPPPEPQPVRDGEANWTLDEEPPRRPRAEPSRATAPKKKTSPDITPPPAPRPRRDRPLRKGDA